MKFILTLLIVFTLSCSNEQSNSAPELRSSRIPEGAFFVKGINTGYWCKADVHSHKNNAVISIYNSVNSKLLMVKRFSVICKLEGNPIWIDDLEEQIEYFDGEKFYLKRPKGKDSCWMQ